jgi:hypothetical protein
MKEWVVEMSESRLQRIHWPQDGYIVEIPVLLASSNTSTRTNQSLRHSVAKRQLGLI